MNLLNIREISADDITRILTVAQQIKEGATVGKSVAGKTVCLLFYENSTRTRISFEKAARKLGMTTINVTASSSSVAKGESLKDTVCTLAAEGVDAIVLRHPSSGAPEFASRYFSGSIINAGDGCHEHPTQALLDLFTIMERKGKIEGLTVALVGDILHSRVARSNIWGLTKLGATVRLVGPATLMPPSVEMFPCDVYYDLEAGLHGADVVMALRIQNERMQQGLLPSTSEYAKLFQIDDLSLDYTLSQAFWGQVEPNCLVMHPGPMNRGVEIADDAADGAHSVILEQVANGVPVRMAALLYGMEANHANSIA